MLRYLLQRYPHFKAVITAGDNPVTDTHLYPVSYGDVQNYRIQAGGKMQLSGPNVVQVPNGHLGGALAYYLTVIDKAAADSDITGVK